MIKHAFRSGMSRSNDFFAAVDAGVPVGVVASELRFNTYSLQIPAYIAAGGAVFIDSGAFTAFRKGTEVDFVRLLDIYQFTAEGVIDAGGDIASLYLVAPDAVGDQQRTLALLQQHRAALRELIGLGASLIVPIQCGAMAVADMLASAASILGTSQFVAGIPSNEAAMTVAQAATLQHHAYHILGRVKMNPEQAARIAALLAHSPGATITADANWMRSRIGAICATTDAVKKSRAGMTWQDRLKHAHPRTTALSNLIRADSAWTA